MTAIRIALLLLPSLCMGQQRPVQFDLHEATRIHDSLWSCVRTKSVNTALRHILEARTTQVDLCEQELAACRVAVDVLDSAVMGAILERDERVAAAQMDVQNATRKASRAKAWSLAGWCVAAITTALLVVTSIP